MFRPALTAPLTLAIGFVLLAGLPLAALGWLGWRLLDQDRALDRQRAHERLENTAMLATRELERGVAAWESVLAADPGSLREGLPRGAALLVFDDDGLVRRAGVALPYHPRAMPDNDLPTAMFAEAEEREFREGRLEAAAATYRRLASTDHPAQRAAALVRLARVLRKQRQPVQALAVYDDLEGLGTTMVVGSPAGLIAHRERQAIFAGAGDVDRAAREASSLADALEQGRFPIDRPTFEFFHESVPSGRTDAARRDALWLAEAAEAWWPLWQRETAGRDARSAGDLAVATVWRRRGSELTALVAPTATLMAAIQLPTADLQVAITLHDSAGSVAWGDPVSGGDRIAKSARETGLPWHVTLTALDTPQAAQLLVSRRNILVAGFVLLALVVTGASYVVFRAVSRELSVARLQSDFVSAVSHEFRTPLAAMRHLTELLEDGNASASRLPEYYRALGRETRRLHTMVENLLDFGRMESGRRTYETEPLGAAGFVRQVVDEFRVRDHQPAPRITLGIDCAAEIDVDRTAMALALTNLLDNAVKYSPPGSTVRVSLDAAGDRVAIGVADEGPGIPDTEQRDVFRKFVRGSAARARNVKGTGIGLAMVQEIVRAHGGRVDLVSEPGRGSRFSVVLPARPGTIPVADGLGRQTL